MIEYHYIITLRGRMGRVKANVTFDDLIYLAPGVTESRAYDTVLDDVRERMRKDGKSFSGDASTLFYRLRPNRTLGGAE